MSDAPPNYAPRGRRVQFTMRTFFVAAVLVSLFGAAASLRSIEAQITAFVVLTWVTMAGVYWIPRWIGPLAALPVGAVVLGLTWGLTLLSVASSRDRLLPGAGWIVIPAAFAWGIGLSVAVALSRLIRLVAGLLGRIWPRRRGESPLGPPKPELPSSSAVGYALWIVGVRALVSIALALAVYCEWIPDGGDGIAAGVSLLLDVPLVPLVLGLLYPHAPDSSLRFLLFTAALYLPLWAGSGWLVGWIVARRERRLRSIDIPAAADFPPPGGVSPFAETAS